MRDKERDSEVSGDRVSVMPAVGALPELALLTGLPRSGTTLSCELLNLLPDARALDEPLQPGAILKEAGWTPDVGPDLDMSAVAGVLRTFAREQRQSLLTEGFAYTKHVQGQVLGAKVADDFTEPGKRRQLRELGSIELSKPASADFVL